MNTYWQVWARWQHMESSEQVTAFFLAFFPILSGGLGIRFACSEWRRVNHFSFPSISQAHPSRTNKTTGNVRTFVCNVAQHDTLLGSLYFGRLLMGCMRRMKAYMDMDQNESVCLIWFERSCSFFTYWFPLRSFCLASALFLLEPWPKNHWPHHLFRLIQPG